jgi:hypothetical protein
MPHRSALVTIRFPGAAYNTDRDVNRDAGSNPDAHVSSGRADGSAHGAAQRDRKP